MSILSATGAGKAYIINAIEGRNELSKNSIDFLEKQVAFWKPTNVLMLGNVVNRYIAVAGPNCSLNWIDISETKSICFLFANTEFDGDISKWEVSQAMNLSLMFKHSKFNKDISNWDVSNCTDFSGMFAYSIFNGDISKWNMKSAIDISDMFMGSEFDGYINDWNVSNVQYADHMFKDMKHQNIDISKWDLYEMSKWREMLSGKTAKTDALLDSLMK